MLLVVDHIMRVLPDMFERRGEAVHNTVLAKQSHSTRQRTLF